MNQITSQFVSTINNSIYEIQLKSPVDYYLELLVSKTSLESAHLISPKNIELPSIFDTTNFQKKIDLLLKRLLSLNVSHQASLDQGNKISIKINLDNPKYLHSQSNSNLSSPV